MHTDTTVTEALMEQRPIIQAVEDPVAFPILTPEQIQALESYGDHVSFAKGECIWRAGTDPIFLSVVIEGEMDISDARSGGLVATHRPGNFSGDVDVLTGRPAVVSASARTNLHILRISGDAVRRIAGERPEIGEILLRAMLRRRNLLQLSGAIGVLVVGSRFDPDALRIREFLARSRYPIVWRDIETDGEAHRLLDDFNVKQEDTPVVALPEGTILRRPTNGRIASELGLNLPDDGETFDVVVVGAGPAGLAAAVYGASEGLRTLVLDSEAPGGQAGTSSRIENYMGFPFGTSGQDLADSAVAQAERFGAKIVSATQVTSLDGSECGVHRLAVTGLGTVTTRSVILATGAQYRALDVDRISDFTGNGIYYAATLAERTLCGRSSVAVVGAGNSAGQAALFLSETVEHVFLINRGSDIRRTMSSYLAARIENLERGGCLSQLPSADVCQLHGERQVEGITVRDRRDGKQRRLTVNSLFVMIGAVPRTEWLRDHSNVALDDKGFILTGFDIPGATLRPRFFLETSCPGVFAAGDARSGSVKRVASAVGEGSMAIAFVNKYLAL